MCGGGSGPCLVMSCCFAGRRLAGLRGRLWGWDGHGIAGACTSDRTGRAPRHGAWVREGMGFDVELAWDMGWSSGGEWRRGVGVAEPGFANRIERHRAPVEAVVLGEERRRRELEDKRAAAGGIVLQSPAQAPSAPPVPSTPPQEDPVQKLTQLKAMMDAGLITPEEYDTKKTEILSRM